MQLSEDKAVGDYIIHSYGEGFVKVNEATLTRSFIVAPAGLLSTWEVYSINDLNDCTVQPLLTLDPHLNLILLGTGKTVRFPSPVLLTSFYERGIGVEIMTTPAACRTYSLLLSEGRRFVCGIIL